MLGYLTNMIISLIFFLFFFFYNVNRPGNNKANYNRKWQEMWMLTLVQTEVKILREITIVAMRNRKQASGKTNQWRSCFDMFMRPKRACEVCVLQYEQSWPGWSALTITVRWADRLYHSDEEAQLSVILSSHQCCHVWPDHCLGHSRYQHSSFFKECPRGLYTLI